MPRKVTARFARTGPRSHVLTKAPGDTLSILCSVSNSGTQLAYAAVELYQADTLESVNLGVIYEIPGGVTNILLNTAAINLRAGVNILRAVAKQFASPFAPVGTVFAEHTFTVTVTQSQVRGPHMVSPTPGSTLRNPVTFTWDAGGTHVTDWWLVFGTEANLLDLGESGPLPPESRSITVDIPFVGLVHVGLWYKPNGRRIRAADYPYNSAGGGPTATPQTFSATIISTTVEETSPKEAGNTFGGWKVTVVWQAQAIRDGAPIPWAFLSSWEIIDTGRNNEQITFSQGDIHYGVLGEQQTDRFHTDKGNDPMSIIAPRIIVKIHAQDTNISRSFHEIAVESKGIP